MRSVKQAARAAAAIGTVAVVLAVCTISGLSARERRGDARVIDAYASQPLAFVENRGQTDARVRFVAQGPRYAFHLTAGAAMLSLIEDTGGRGGDSGVVLGLRFIGASPRATVAGAERLPGDANYLHGADPARWQRGVPRFAEVVYRRLWPSIDMRLMGEGGALRYEFRVAPGARVTDIRLAYDGAAGLALDDAGGLEIRTAHDVLRDAPPVAYQTIDGVRVPVDSRYVLDGREYGFAVGAYDPRHELVIDPGIAYSTYLGGGADDGVTGVVVDAAGNAYVTGYTQSPDFPTTAGAFDRSGAVSNSLEAFVTKLNANGALVYSTFLGGSNFEWGRAIAVDAAGSAYIAGQTKSSNFPTTSNAFDRTFNVDTCPRCGVDQYDAFVTKLNAAGSALVYSTFLGGFDIDDALAIAVDGAGNAYVGGETGSSNFPVTTAAFDRTRNGAYDAFVTKLNPAGSALTYSTFLGGLEVDYAGGVAVDAAGNAHVVGITRSADFPVTPGAFDTTHNGLFDVFVTKLNAAGSALVYSTFLGGSDFDSSGGIALDGGGNAYIAGGTMSLNFPTTPGVFMTATDGNDGFVTKLNATGTALVYSTFIGGTGVDGVSNVVLDGSNRAWIAGTTDAADFPTTPDAFDRSINGSYDAFLAQLDANGAVLLHSTFLGGTSSDGASDLALDAAGNIVVVGGTASVDFPTTAGAFDRVFNGDPLIFWGDSYVAKFAMGAAPPPPPPPPPPPGGMLPAPSLVSPANDARFRPGATIAFDWSDVAGAASYTIQIDTSQTFGAPFTVEQTVNGSQFSTSSLPTTRMWWRVRANDSAGAAGTWSAVRRLEVKN